MNEKFADNYSSLCQMTDHPEASKRLREQINGNRLTTKICRRNIWLLHQRLEDTCGPETVCGKDLIRAVIAYFSRHCKVFRLIKSDMVLKDYKTLETIYYLLFRNQYTVYVFNSRLQIALSRSIFDKKGQTKK